MLHLTEAGQALREDAPDVRKELDEEIKDVDDVMNNNPYSSPQQHHMQYPSLQAKKVVKNIEFSRSINEGNGGGYSILVKVLTAKNKELEAKVGTLEGNIRAKDNEIVELKRKIEEMTAPAPTPAPKQRHPPTHQGLGVVGGAARGAAGGAMKGAIAGAILPGMDAADGAKAGAAVGATSGGLRAIRGRRIARGL